MRLFQYQLEQESYFAEPALRERMTYWLRGRAPALALVSRRSDGLIYLSFTLAQGSDEPGLRGIDFLADPSSPSPLLSYTERYVGSSPLDTIRSQQSREPTLQHDILYISAALRQWESESAAERDRYATPSPSPAQPASPAAR